MSVAAISLRAAIALALTLVACPVVITAMRRRGVVDIPNVRSSHEIPVVRGGGLAPALVCLGVLVVTAAGKSELLGPLLAMAGIAVIGLADDLSGGLSVGRRLACTAVVAVGATALIVEGWDQALPVRALTGISGVLVIVGFTNSFNFMDGINGISAVSALVIGLSYAAAGVFSGAPTVPLIAMVIAAGAVAFLPYNAPVAKVILGDVGSYFFGAALSSTAVLAVREGIPLEAAAAPLAIYVGDTGWTVVRRVASGERWSEPHRDHAYQRLTILGWSHSAVTALVGMLTTVCGALGLISLIGGLGPRIIAAAAIVAVVIGYLALPGWLARHRSIAVRA